MKVPLSKCHIIDLVDVLPNNVNLLEYVKSMLLSLVNRLIGTTSTSKSNV